MKKSDGNYANILQQGSYITDPKNNLPAYSIAMVTDVSAVKKDSSMVFCIEKKCESAGQLSYQPIESLYFYPDPDEAKFTKREKEILCRLAEGFNSKMIANMLNISENTVANHRKNMLRKSNTGNVVQLVAQAIKNGII